VKVIEGVDYRYRRPGDINTVCVKGYIGFDMIRFEDNDYGRFIREIWGTDRLPNIEPITDDSDAFIGH
jgi:hypothetical protein